MNSIEQEIAAASLTPATQDDAGAVQGRYLFPETFSGFAGHFPGNAILPAIVEVMTVVSLLGEQTGRRQRLVGIEDAKFLTPVRPNQEILVRCRPKSFRGKEYFEAQLSVAGSATATMLIDVACAGEGS